MEAECSDLLTEPTPFAAVVSPVFGIVRLRTVAGQDGQDNDANDLLTLVEAVLQKKQRRILTGKRNTAAQFSEGLPWQSSIRFDSTSMASDVDLNNISPDRVLMPRDFEMICESCDLEVEVALSKCDFLVQEDGMGPLAYSSASQVSGPCRSFPEDSGIIEVQSLDDALAFCMAEKFADTKIAHPLHEVGLYANKLVPKKDRETSRLQTLLFKYSEFFCLTSHGTVTVRKRPAWPDMSKGRSVSEPGDADVPSEFVRSTSEPIGRLRKTVSDIDITECLDFRGSLGRTPTKSDSATLSASFANCIEQHGILRLGECPAQFLGSRVEAWNLHRSGFDFGNTQHIKSGDRSCSLQKLTMPALCAASGRTFRLVF